MTKSTSGNHSSGEREKILDEVKKALDLSIQIANTRKRLDALSAQTFKAKPAAPVRRPIPQPQYPAIKPQVPFWSAELIPAIFFWPWILVYYFGPYQTKIKNETERIRNSPEYQQQCAVIDKAYRQGVALAEEQYQAALKQYNEQILSVYEKELAQWTNKHNQEIAALTNELDKLEKGLAAHYEATKVVPVQYRKINALQYVYDCMRSSNYTVAEAINSYEQAIRRQIEQERLEEERRYAEAEERRADAEERRLREDDRKQAAPDDGKKDYYWSSDCIQRRNIRNGKYKVIRKCEGCRVAPFCSRYK